MKQGIHPQYVECTVTCSCGNTFKTHATVSGMKVELCNECHPFYTGQQKFVDTCGRVQRFADKFGSASAAVAEREAAKKAAAPAPAAAPAAVEEIVEEDDNDDEIMAVISAAIAAYAEEEGTSYTIRDVKKRDKRARSAWSLAGIGENTRPF